MEKLTDTARIVGLLKRVLEQRVLLSATIENHSQEFTTAIINTSPAEGYLMLDELKPENGQALLKQNQTLKLKAQMDGVLMVFSTTVMEIGEQDAIAYYKIQIPAQMDYHQRRQSVRIPASATKSLPITLKSKNDLILTGSMADLSIGGVRIRFDSDLPSILEVGQQLDCSFPLPPDNKQLLLCNLAIKVIKRQHEPFKAAYLGGQFIDITKPQERQIERTVMLLQRAVQQNRNS